MAATDQGSPSSDQHSAGRRVSWRTRARQALVTVGLLGLVFPPLLVLPLRWINPATTAFMVQHWVTSAAPYYHWTDWDDISPHAPVAVIAAEDQTFFEHRGFDVDSIQDALAEAQQGGRVRGASTISQQVSKNLFLWPGRSVTRKGLEAYVTVFVELFWPKRRILEVYLNVAEFGDGIYGIAAASDHFFDTVPARIDADQAALLAAVLPNPKRLKVDEPSVYVRERQAWIRTQMIQLGGTELLSATEP